MMKEKDLQRIAAKPIKIARRRPTHGRADKHSQPCSRHMTMCVSTGNRAPRHGWGHSHADGRASFRGLHHGCAALRTVVCAWSASVCSPGASFDLYSSFNFLLKAII